MLKQLERKLNEKAYQYRVIVLEETQCEPDRRPAKQKRNAETNANFFLADPTGKYDIEATTTLAHLIHEEVDLSGSFFDRKVKACDSTFNTGCPPEAF